MQITKEVLIRGTGCNDETAENWLEPINASMAKFGIESANATACFLANIGVESGGLRVFVENLNYSAQNLANVWPNRFAIEKDSAQKVPNELAKSIARNPEKIANITYSNRLGNGDVESGDGWKYRGQGPIQITGKANIERCAKAIGIDLDSDPSQLTTPQAGALSAAWFFADKGCIKAADDGHFGLVVKLINGAYPCKANRGADREALRQNALLAIKSM